MSVWSVPPHSCGVVTCLLALMMRSSILLAQGGGATRTLKFGKSMRVEGYCERAHRLDLEPELSVVRALKNVWAKTRLTRMLLPFALPFASSLLVQDLMLELRHPNVIQCLFLPMLEDSVPRIVMELAPLGDLHHYVIERYDGHGWSGLLAHKESDHEIRRNARRG